MGDRALRSVQAVVPAWTGSSALRALEELVKVSISATDGLAHRARLSHTELEALRHMMEEETGRRPPPASSTGWRPVATWPDAPTPATAAAPSWRSPTQGAER